MCEILVSLEKKCVYFILNGILSNSISYIFLGGSYYYHWMRDAGLSIKAWIDINDNDYDKIQEVLSAFTKWVKVVQNKPDPNDIDVRIGKTELFYYKTP